MTARSAANAPDGDCPSNMLSELARLADDDFSQTVLTGAANALSDQHNPLRLNFFSTAMRILLEHTMDRFAPIEQTMRCAWYTQERDNGEPTRAQRIKYAIQGGLTDAFVEQELNVEIGPIQRAIVNAVGELGAQIHARELTMVAAVDEQDALARRIITAMEVFFGTLQASRNDILAPIQEELDDAAIDALLTETIQEVDELASHHSVEEVYVDRTVVHELGHDEIVYRATGSVAVCLQWGSNSDMRRGDGAELEQSFPFTCDITVPLDDPWDLRNAEAVYGVDTSSWTDMMDPDDDA